jgi:pimeloyl-ACP methyl ester carboxylesterase
MKGYFRIMNRFVWLVLVAVMLFLSSCDLMKMVDRKQQRGFERMEIHAHSFKDANGVHFVHQRCKGKETVLFIPGYGSSGTGQYYRTAALLKDDYDLILPDLLSFGGSKYTGTDHSIDAQVEHVKMLLDSLKIDKPFTIIGNSYGGIVGTYFAEKYPALVKKLVIYDSPVLHYSLGYADSLAKSRGVDDVTYLLAPTTVDEAKKSLDLIFYKRPYIPRIALRQMVKKGIGPNRELQVKFVDHLREHQDTYLSHQFNLKMPVYIIWGDSDILIPLSTAYGIKQALNVPDDHFILMPKCAHAANVEYPEDFAKLVRTLMSK